MDKMTMGVSYGVSFATTLYSVLDSFTPDEWAAIGILSGVIFGTLTFLTNFYFQWRRLKIQEREGDGGSKE
ncbi:lysis protein [Salmonella enterica subsp. diarizonae]|nr:lysis protein [Salmonella enterica]ECF6066173.1 lysis protein [Salmonella enterica subsp. diarizonae]ECJ4480348.1 lysis protein [Salmonella enterica subsp. diarizonae]EDV3180998.1 lysis protein [Salmonella enterica subsp. diarizonae]EFP2800049.1 lysis protein [Salmonella enterica]